MTRLSRRRWSARFVAAAMLAPLWLTAPAPADRPAPATRPATTQPADGMAYIRYVPDTEGGATMQAAVVRFMNDEGKTVDLIAAVHIGERAYFKAIDESFADYDAVLFELVAPKAMLVPTTQGSSLRKMRTLVRPTTHPTTRNASMAFVGRLQQVMQQTLKLSFQTEEIDYLRPNLVHADLDAETFTKLQADRGESFLGLGFNAFLKEMGKARDGRPAEPPPNLFDILAALKDPDGARRLKLMLGRQLTALELDDDNSVIIGERNKAALGVLREKLASHDGRHFAIFYGAAHLKPMAESLVRDFAFRQVGPPFWRVAWDMTAPPASPAQTQTPMTQPTPHRTAPRSR